MKFLKKVLAAVACVCVLATSVTLTSHAAGGRISFADPSTAVGDSPPPELLPPDSLPPPELLPPEPLPPDSLPPPEPLLPELLLPEPLPAPLSDLLPPELPLPAELPLPEPLLEVPEDLLELLPDEPLEELLELSS